MPIMRPVTAGTGVGRDYYERCDREPGPVGDPRRGPVPPEAGRGCLGLPTAAGAAVGAAAPALDGPEGCFRPVRAVADAKEATMRTKRSRWLVVTDKEEALRLIRAGHGVVTVRLGPRGIETLMTKTPVWRRLEDRMRRAGLSLVDGEIRKTSEVDPPSIKNGEVYHEQS